MRALVGGFCSVWCCALRADHRKKIGDTDGERNEHREKERASDREREVDRQSEADRQTDRQRG